MWKGSDIPTAEQGVRILGTPLGHPDFVHTENVLKEHGVLLSRIPLVEDVQSAWALLLHCAGGRANCLGESCQARCGAELRCRAHERTVGMFAQHVGQFR